MRIPKDYTSHLFIYNEWSSNDKGWTLYHSKPWAHEFSKRKSYKTTLNRLKKMVRKEFPRIQSFKPSSIKSKHKHQYAVFKPSNKTDFSLLDFCFELMECGFDSNSVNEWQKYVIEKELYDKFGNFYLDEQLNFDNFFNVQGKDFWHMIDFWFKRVNSQKLVVIHI